MTIAVIFGGKSCEHNISIITAVQIMKGLSNKHKVTPIYIDNSGVWFSGSNLTELSLYSEKKPNFGKKVHLRPNSNILYSEKGKKVCAVSVAVICCHGLNGEDGTLQGLLTLSGIAYTCSKVRASSVGMDKITMKRLFMQSGLPTLAFESFSFEQYTENLFPIVERIKKNLKFPLIVKPSNLGSSIGISIAHNFQELFESISVAFKWDCEVLVENALENFTELNCAVLGSSSGSLLASEIEEPIGWKEFLTYEDKYMKKSKGSGRKFPADISSAVKEQIQSLAKDAFAAIGASGIARIDFLMKDEHIYVNEINTIPGSLANYLFPFSIDELVERLIEIALKEKQKSDNLNYSYKPSPTNGSLKLK